jgi:adenylate cyclase
MKKGRLTSLLLSGLLVLFCLGVYALGGFDGLENKSLDLRFRLRGDRPSQGDVVIVTVDEKSIARMGRWPWSRDVHARLIDRLTEAGARAVIFDVLFTEPDKSQPEGDAALGQAARRNGRVVFGMLFQTGADSEPTDPLFPIPPLRQSGVGVVNIMPELDGVSRKLPVWLDYQGQVYPSLAFAAYAAALGAPPGELLKTLDIPAAGAWNEMDLNFLGGYQSFPYFSYVDVYQRRAPLHRFRDKVVLVGGTATALFDFKAVPNVHYFPGVEVHATALDNLLTGRHLRKKGPLWTVTLILLFGLGSGLLFSWAPARIAGLSAFGILVAYFGLCQFLFSRRDTALEFVAPAAALGLTYVVVLFHRFVTVEKEKRWIKGAFSQYLSPKLIEVITADPSRLRLGGEEREMSVFFSDLAGFTSISERLKPTELVSVLNEYLTEMSDILLRHGGYVDKYIGDAIMAFWNAPVGQPHHATLACFSAIDQMERLADLQKRFVERGLPLIDCRVGINSGNMVVGNMGTKNKFNYTVMGDSVNLASRLEGANKEFGTHIMISEFTFERVKNDVEARPLDFLRVKGKAIPIRVYELAARKGGLTDEQRKAFALYEEGLAFYRDRRFDQALEAFRKVQGFLPNDGPSRLYIERCERYQAAPPPKDWDGVYVMTSK